MKRVRATVAAVPEPFLETERTKRFVFDLIESMPEGATIINVGAGSSDLGKRVINIDIFDSGTTDVVASALELPFEDGSVDLVIMQGVLEHVRDERKTLDECYRVMRPGAKFYTEMPFLQPYHESPIDMRRCTLPGLAEMCLPLRHIESGMNVGPASTVTWILRELIAGVLAGGHEYYFPRVHILVGWVLFPFRYLDIWLEKKPHLHRIGSSFYYIGEK